MQAAIAQPQTFNDINAVMGLLIISIMAALISADLGADSGLIGKKMVK